MEPLKIQIEVSASHELLDTLKRIAAASIFSQLSSEDVEALKTKETAPAQEPAKEEVEETPVQAEEIIDDLPPDDAVLEISDDELAEATRNAVARLKAQHKLPSLIKKEIFSKFGIDQSIECPQEHRGELVRLLNSVAA